VTSRKSLREQCFGTNLFILEKHLVFGDEEMNDKETPSPSVPLTHVVLHGFREEQRDIYMKGYIDSANALMKICETVFAGSTGIQYVRERFAAQIVDEAELLDEIKTLYPS
jgi:hypothetical protein